MCRLWRPGTAPGPWVARRSYRAPGGRRDQPVSESTAPVPAVQSAQGGIVTVVASITSILEQRSPLTAVEICRELRSVGVDAKPGNVRSLLAMSFHRFVSLTPGLWQLQDPAMSKVDRVIQYEESRGRRIEANYEASLSALDAAGVAAIRPRPRAAAKPRPGVAPAKPRPMTPAAKKLKVACPRCLKVDVVANADGWSICLGCGLCGSAG